MFETLICSAVPRRVAPTRALLAAGAHTLVIFAAIRLTSLPELTAPEKIETIHFPSPHVPERVPVATPEAGAGISVTAAPPLVSAPLEIPTTIPSVTLGPALDPEALRRLVGFSPGPPPSTGAEPAGTAWSVTDVDEPAAIVHQPAPRYPPALRHAGLSGKVLLEFVIDTTGHAEAGSLRVVERTRSGFDEAAMESVSGALFQPARVKGRAVRQRGQQWVVFRIVPE